MLSRFSPIAAAGFSIVFASCIEVRADLPIHGPSYRPVKLSSQLVPIQTANETADSAPAEPSIFSRLKSFVPGLSSVPEVLIFPTHNLRSQLENPREAPAPEPSQSRLNKLISKVGLNRLPAETGVERNLSLPVVQTSFAASKLVSKEQNVETPLPVVLPKKDESSRLPGVDQILFGNR